MPVSVRLARSTLLTIGAVLLLSVASPVLAQGPSPSPSASPSATVLGPQGSWLVESYDPSGEGLVAPLPNVPFRLDFLSDGRLEGEAGCGTLFGGYFVEGDVLRMDILNKGLDPCGARRIEAGIQLATAIEQVRSWRPVPGGLELLDEAGLVRAVLVPVAVASPAGEWIVERVARANGRLVAAAADPVPALTLDEDGTFTGSTGCRQFRGDWFGDAGRITIVTSTLDGLPCTGDARRLERRLLRSLELVTDWEAADDAGGGGLTLTEASGAPLVSLLPAEPAPLSPELSPSPVPSALPDPSAAPSP